MVGFMVLIEIKKKETIKHGNKNIFNIEDIKKWLNGV